MAHSDLFKAAMERFRESLLQQDARGTQKDDAQIELVPTVSVPFLLDRLAPLRNLLNLVNDKQKIR